MGGNKRRGEEGISLKCRLQIQRKLHAMFKSANRDVIASYEKAPNRR
jgi:hypothetical protein